MAPPLTVIVSGCHSGPNPSPGLGIARSLRLAYPEIRLIARDFSPGASGIHSDVFDAAWICPPWEDADLGVLEDQLRLGLEGAWLISGLDVEVRWLAGLRIAGVLGPPAIALEEVGKPAITAAGRLSARVPEWLPLGAGDQEVHAFCRRHDWRVWVKGPTYESRLISSWPELQAAAGELGATWGSEGLFVQAHVPGSEVSVGFAAYGGELLGAVFLDKLTTTEQGKVWSGAISEVPQSLLSALRVTIRDLHWTGGGELEFVRDASDQLWLFDWNPRFPAWIHGATLAGVNLAAMLLERASGKPAAPTPRQPDRFVRVVVEIPAHASIPLPHASSHDSHERVPGKHPSGMPQLARRLRRPSIEISTRRPSELPRELADDLLEAAAGVTTTPVRVLLRQTSERRFSLAAQFRDRTGIGVAYSLKTNPDAAIMRLGLRHGLLAEAISKEEVAWATANGWSPSRVLYNGPVALDPGPRASRRLSAVFADSVPIFSSYLRSAPADVVGVRLRPPGAPSRFGVPLDDPRSFRTLVGAVRESPPEQALGISFHVPSSEVGLRRWERLARQVGHFAVELANLSGRPIALMDLGGGWTPSDFDNAALGSLPELARWLLSELGSELKVMIEPGKALAEPSQAVLARVVEIRRAGCGRREAILDGGVSLVPHVRTFPHRMVVIRGGCAAPLGPGEDSLLGPLCMESDRVADGIALPPNLEVGDLVAICDAGAYDASMSYPFARGGAHEFQRSDRS